MGDKRFHINKAQRNEEFYSSCGLQKSKFNEWCIVVLFYTSMHYIDAVLCQDTSLSKKMRDPNDHRTRNVAVSQCSELGQVTSMYAILRDRSREARYNTICFPNSYLHNFITLVFEPTRAYLRKTLGLTN